MSLRPFIRPISLLGISASTLLLATAINSSTIFRSKMSNMSTDSASSPWPVRQYQPRHTTWPYKPSDFARQDPSTDTDFYAAPRFVTHIDDAAIASLRAYYATVLPQQGRILDFCSSWISHYPPEIERAAAASTDAQPSSLPSPSSSSTTPASNQPRLQVFGLGLNHAELAANPVLTSGRLVHDLNASPDLGAAIRDAGWVEGAAAAAAAATPSKLDAATNVVSTDYLTQPVAVLRSLRGVTNPGGRVHLAISNRCFPTKAIARWLRVSEDERVLMVADFLHFAGWKRIEIVELSDGTADEEGGKGGGGEGGLRGLMRRMGMNSRDPLWVVRAVNEE